jgi:hypothetical protein
MMQVVNQKPMLHAQPHDTATEQRTNLSFLSAPFLLHLSFFLSVRNKLFSTYILSNRASIFRNNLKNAPSQTNLASTVKGKIYSRTPVNILADYFELNLCFFFLFRLR